MTILVTAASKHGATAEIGASIASGLSGLGVPAVFHDPRTVFRLEEYDGVVLGSAVYVGNWMAEAREFAWSYANELSVLPVWLFSSGPVGNPLKPLKPEESVNVQDVLDVTGAREHRVFAGRLDRHLLGFGERAMVRAVGAQEGDFRDWKAIADWSSEIAAVLRSAQVQPR